jgi:hypothetical protein
MGVLSFAGAPGPLLITAGTVGVLWVFCGCTVGGSPSLLHQSQRDPAQPPAKLQFTSVRRSIYLDPKQALTLRLYQKSWKVISFSGDTCALPIIIIIIIIIQTQTLRGRALFYLIIAPPVQTLSFDFSGSPIFLPTRIAFQTRRPSSLFAETRGAFHSFVERRNFRGPPLTRRLRSTSALPTIMAELESPQEQDHASKLPFTAEYGGSNGDSSGESTGPRDLDDSDSYKPIGPPATRKEVWSYYAYYAGNNGIGSYQ